MQVRYTLAFPARPQHGRRRPCRCTTGRGDWRLDRGRGRRPSCCAPRPRSSARCRRRRDAGGTVLLFPGAAADALRHAATCSSTRPPASVDFGRRRRPSRPSSTSAPAGHARRPRHRAGATLRACLAGARTDRPARCPTSATCRAACAARSSAGSPRDSVVVGHRRGRRADVVRHGRPSTAHYRRLTFQNRPVRGSGPGRRCRCTRRPTRSRRCGSRGARRERGWPRPRCGGAARWRSAVPAVARRRRRRPGRPRRRSTGSTTGTSRRCGPPASRGQGVTIAEIDTGVNAALPELPGRVLRGHRPRRAGGNGQVDREIDAFGHGTAMASIMVARPGPARTSPASRRTRRSCRSPCRSTAPPTQAGPTTCPRRSATPPTTAPRSSACRWAASGRRAPDGEPCPADEQAAIFYALRKGAVVVASVGNTGPTQQHRRGARRVPRRRLGRRGRRGRATSRASPTAQPYLTLVAPGVGVPSLGRVAGPGLLGQGHEPGDGDRLGRAGAGVVEVPDADAAGDRRPRAGHARRPPHDAQHAPTATGCSNAYRAVTATVPADAPNPVYDAGRAVPARQRPARRADGARRRAARPRGPTAATRPFEVGATPRRSTAECSPGSAVGRRRVAAPAGRLRRRRVGLAGAAPRAAAVAAPPNRAGRRRRTSAARDAGRSRRPAPGPSPVSSDAQAAAGGAVDRADHRPQRGLRRRLADARRPSSTRSPISISR